MKVVIEAAIREFRIPGFPLGLVCSMMMAGFAAPAWGQDAVMVRARFDTNIIAAGQSTLLRVFGQVATNYEADAERIVTWYVDVLNVNGAVAAADYEAMTRPRSDNDEVFSSSGVDDGDHRRGIYDTFLDLPGAGVGDEVELLAVPVTGLGAGLAEFTVEPGSGAGLTADFRVAPITGGDPYVGGNYDLAGAVLEVVEFCAITLEIERGPQGGGPGDTLLLTFEPCAGFDHTVQSSAAVGPGAVWSDLPGAPHNSGMATVTNSLSQRFFRVRAVEP